MTKCCFVLVTLMLSLYCSAQAAKPKPAEPLKPLTAEEKLAVRAPQVRILQIAQQIEALKAQQAAQQAELAKAVDEVYRARHLDKKDAVVCDGPGGGGCETAPVGDLALLPLAKK